jgi:methylated-DNA-[protein]-cysteine S-methyltransferase
MTRFFTHIPSPIGKIIIAADEHGALTDVHFVDGKYVPTVDDSWRDSMAHPTLLQTKHELDEYFAGQRKTFGLKLAPQGTAFQRAAWTALTQIPFGETRSYGEQAKLLGNAKASRAVGAANGKNPIAIIIPCHRVIGVSGHLTGYASGLHRKQFLLALEGIT